MSDMYMKADSNEIVKQMETKINNIAIEIIELNESKASEHSTKYLKLRMKLFENCYRWVNSNNQIIKLCRRYSQLKSSKGSNKDHLYFEYSEELINIIDTYLKKYSPEKVSKSGFIGYLSYSLKMVISGSNKSKNEISLDATINEDNDTLEDLLKDDKNLEVTETVEGDIFKKKTTKLLLQTIQLCYEKTKAGRELKTHVYTYFILEYLFTLSNEEMTYCCNKYSFINKDAVNFFKNKDKVPTEKEFAEYTGTAASKYSSQIKKLTVFLASNEDFAKLQTESK